MKTYQCHKIVKAAQIVEFHQPSQDDPLWSAVLEDGTMIGIKEFAKLHRKDYTPVVGDYVVEIEVGYRSIGPQAEFEAGYKVIPPGNVSLLAIEPYTAMSFSGALIMLKNGYRVARSGWNGNGMFLFLVNASHFTVNREPLLSILGEGTEVDYRAHIDIHCADGTIAVWTPSVIDLLTSDWGVIEAEAAPVDAAAAE